MKSRLYNRVSDRDDVSISILELLGMVVTAWALTVDANVRPRYAGEYVLMWGDNMSETYGKIHGEGRRKRGWGCWRACRAVWKCKVVGSSALGM